MFDDKAANGAGAVPRGRGSKPFGKLLPFTPVRRHPENSGHAK
jgi:hypothetical protein